MKTSTQNLIAIFALTATLAGCGGGGDASAPPPAPAPAPAPSTSDLVTSVPQATYAAGSEELAAFSHLNTERGRCGFGLLAQNTQIDAAARDHALYQLINNMPGHTQNATTGPNGFTGANVSDRLAFRGYTNIGVAGEVSTWAGSTSLTGQGIVGMRRLLSAPYHALGLLGFHRDVGVSVKSDVEANSTGTTGKAVVVMADIALKKDVPPQMLASDAIATYPCEGTNGIPFALLNETPNPIPGRDLSVNPAGVAIMVATRTGNNLTIDSVTLVPAAGGAAQVMRTAIKSDNDPNKNIVGTNTAFILADAPQAPSTTYRATVAGKNNGVAFTKVFTFTTAATLQ